jgi:hypothetical protein
VVDGALTANGQNAGGYRAAGSGGSILVRCKAFYGAGTLSANGGNGGSRGGGGGGGRIAVLLCTSANDPALLRAGVLRGSMTVSTSSPLFSGILSTAGGAGGSGSAPLGDPGEEGSIVFLKVKEGSVILIR